jgi:hypothetical protein
MSSTIEDDRRRRRRRRHETSLEIAVEVARAAAGR